MTKRRWRIFIFGLLLSAVLAFFLRDVVHSVLIVPLAYLAWVGAIYYSFIPQVIIWIIVLITLTVILLANFVPEPRFIKPRKEKVKPIQGQVEALANWMIKAPEGIYFKWLIAHRLGGIARGLNEMSGRQSRVQVGEEAVKKYLDAGLNTSFVDYPRPAYPFQRPARTVMDLDPKDAVDYLESQLAEPKPTIVEKNRDRNH